MVLIHHTIINLNGQTVLEILKFEKSSNLIGRELLGPYLDNQNMRFHRIVKNAILHDSSYKTYRSMTNILIKTGKTFQKRFRPISLFFSKIWEKNNFSEKSGSITFLCLWSPNFMQKIRKKLWANSENSTSRTHEGMGMNS